MTNKIINLDIDSWLAPIDHHTHAIMDKIIDTTHQSDKVKDLSIELYQDCLNYVDTRTGKRDEFYSSAANPFYARVAIAGYIENGNLPNKHMFKIEKYIPDALLEKFKVKAMALNKTEVDTKLFSQEVVSNDHYIFTLMDALISRANMQVDQAAIAVRDIIYNGANYLKDDKAFQAKLSEMGTGAKKRHITALEVEYSTAKLRLNAVTGLMDGGHSSSEAFNIVCQSDGANLNNIVMIANREREKLRLTLAAEKTVEDNTDLQASNVSPVSPLKNDDDSSEENSEENDVTTQMTKHDASHHTITTPSQIQLPIESRSILDAKSDMRTITANHNVVPSLTMYNYAPAASLLVMVGIVAVAVWRRPLVKLAANTARFFCGKKPKSKVDHEELESFIEKGRYSQVKIKTSTRISFGR